MAKGFHHPVHGYWQTTDEPSDIVRSGYPEGTQEVPLRPSRAHEWNGTDWVAVPPNVAELQAIERSQAEALRAIAFRLEADPLFFKWQAGEGTQEAWAEKRAEIRLRHPYPEDNQ